MQSIMNFKIENYYIDYSFFIVLIIFISLLISYRKLLLQSIDRLRYILFINRFLILFITLVILFNPILSVKNYSNENISVVIDNSESMLYNIENMNIDEQFLYNKIIKNINSKGYNTVLYKFSDKFELISEIESLDYSGKLTDFNNIFNNFII